MPPSCELQVAVFHNGSIQGTHWFCLSDVVLPCFKPGHPDNTTSPNYVGKNYKPAACMVPAPVLSVERNVLNAFKKS